ncbi:hypothetical protein [Arachnia propionica]|uniref:Lipoprotein n=1 Tax=Arachnia propionica TaxID=1750 RepID=A0A3S4Y6L6_9ACTN|nr:hypothetical protein [Arachnia propionica]VEH69913.1 Uncharacterised protein [Arachnia propionica]
MKHHFGGAAAVAVAVVLLLSSCGGQSPRPGSSDSESWGTAPQQPPRTTTTPSSSPPVPSPSKPQPSETFTPEQLEAANTVIEFFHILDGVLSDPEAETQSLMNITIGQTQTIQLERVSEYREQGRVQTGTVGVHITGASEARQEDDMKVITVQTCTDTTNYNVVDSKTGKPIMKPGERPIYLAWNIDVVKTGEGWKVGDATNENALRCPA